MADIQFDDTTDTARDGSLVSPSDFIARVFERFVLGLQWSRKSLMEHEPYEMVEVDSLDHE